MDQPKTVEEMIEAILASSRTILISCTDHASGPGKKLYEASATNPTKFSAAKTLEGCIEGLTANPRTKVCIREDCDSKGVPRPLWLFGPDKDAKQKHSAVCQNCESKRIGGLAKKRKGKLAGERSANPPSVNPSMDGSKEQQP